MAIRPPLDDLYGALGVERDASPDELSAAFRRRAKQLHPDAGVAGPGSTEEFKALSRAYAVLRDPAQRARYDAQRCDRPAATGFEQERGPGEVAPAPTAHPPARGADAVVTAGRWRLTRRTARRMVAAGAALVVLGVVAGAWVVALDRSEAELRARGVAAVATVVEVDGQRRLQFTTRGGETVVATEAVRTGSEAPPLGSRIGVHYDRADPTRIVADDSHTARDVTLWIVAVKFLVGGAILVGVGVRRLRR